MAAFALVMFLLSAISAEDICGYKVDATVEIISKTGEKTLFSVGIADTPQKHEKGLMFCKELKKGRGLLFIFNDDRQHFFWMKNTPVELAIIYINREFKIVSVRRGEPFSQKTLPSIFESRYVLEINWMEGKKIVPGDSVKFKMK
jgi:uncharacterized protein